MAAIVLDLPVFPGWESLTAAELVDARSRVVAEVTLEASEGGVNGAAFVPSGTSLGPGRRSPDPDTGLILFALDANSAIQPAGTRWRWTYRYGQVVYPPIYFVVTDGGFQALSDLADALEGPLAATITAVLNALPALVAGAGITVTDDAVALTSTVDAIGVDVQTFTAGGTWTKPANALDVDVFVIAAGGGSGSGQRVAATTDDAYGGCASGPGGVTHGQFMASELAATEAVTVGVGGTGGAAKTTTGNGLDGTAGGFSQFGSDSLCVALGGAKGTGGKTSGQTPGIGGTGNITPAGMPAAPAGGAVVLSGRKGGLGAGAGNASTGGSYDGGVGPGGGGGGGGLTGSGSLLLAASAGGTGGPFTGVFGTAVAGGTVADANPGTDGGDGASITAFRNGSVRAGGGGGAGGNGANLAATAGGDGGAGGSYGAGAGGGGNGVGADSGAGNDGAPGLVVVITRIGAGT